MKINNWTRRIRLVLVAAGLCLPLASHAAELGTNLVVNGGFESVNLVDGPFTSVGIEGGWAESGADGTPDLFAYPYSSNYSGTAVDGAGDYHFSGGFGTAEGEVQVSQRLDVSGGATGVRIASGTATYQLSAFFSSYLLQDDASAVRVSFLDSADAALASVSVGGNDFVNAIPAADGVQRDWAQDLAVGAIPVGTQSVLLEIVAGDSDTNHDGYVDLVNFSVVPEPTTAALAAAGLITLGRRRR